MGLHSEGIRLLIHDKNINQMLDEASRFLRFSRSLLILVLEGTPHEFDATQGCSFFRLNSSNAYLNQVMPQAYRLIRPVA